MRRGSFYSGSLTFTQRCLFGSVSFFPFTFTRLHLGAKITYTFFFGGGAGGVIIQLTTHGFTFLVLEMSGSPGKLLKGSVLRLTSRPIKSKCLESGVGH